MKMVKSLLLGSAAGFVAFTGAQAADLPLAEPVEYVKICDTYGKGFFYIPGTDTCLKVGGFVRFDQRYRLRRRRQHRAGLRAGRLRSVTTNSERYSNRARLSISSTLAPRPNGAPCVRSSRFRSDAELGRVPERWRQTTTSSRALHPVRRLHGWPHLVVLRLRETATIADFFSESRSTPFAYTWSFGDGFTATVGVEDKANRFFGTRVVDSPSDRRRRRCFADASRLPRQEFGRTSLAALRVDQAGIAALSASSRLRGSTQLSAAVKDNAGDDLLDIDPDIGWAVQAGVAINLPTAVEGSYVWVQGTFAEGAADYGFLGTFLQTSAWIAPDFDLQRRVRPSSGLSAAASTSRRRKPLLCTVRLLSSTTTRRTVLRAPFEAIQAAAGILWKPVENLNIFLEGEYITVDFDDVDGDRRYG